MGSFPQGSGQKINVVETPSYDLPIPTQLNAKIFLILPLSFSISSDVFPDMFVHQLQWHESKAARWNSIVYVPLRKGTVGGNPKCHICYTLW